MQRPKQVEPPKKPKLVGPGGVDYSWWERQGAATFMDHDWDHPIRQTAADHLPKFFKEPFSMAEVGPGNGLDYRKHWRGATLDKNMSFAMFEGCARFVEYLKQEFPEVTVVLGGFEHLGVQTFDVVFVKDVLQHQPHFKDPLARMLAAAKRLVIVAWNAAPADKERIRFQEPIRVHDNLYKRADVVKAVEEQGFMLQNVSTASDTKGRSKELWVLERVKQVEVPAGPPTLSQV